MFIFVATVVAILGKFPLTELPNYTVLQCFGGAAVGIGTFLRIFTLGYAAPHSSGRNRSHQVALHLNTRGIYSIIQHPLYFANLLLWLGIALISNQWSFVVGVVLLSLMLFPVLIQRESAFLRAQFGRDYAQWYSVTPTFFPKPGLWKAPQTSFQWIRLLATEYPTWVSICAGTLLALLMADYRFNGSLTWNLTHFGWCLLGLLIGFSGRFFKYIVVRKWLKMPI